ncbi:hypothetical protein G6F57_015615 [Rhizopus arrhizus]|uniref:C2H2-type domain-containing protein n=1 Tax=Rhizopus oryzae TaxID=64495 RepID=A0A9P7BSA7_RHIOR|nr:hypothetical protein G6F23_012912 [Rhizopus arrhizus]KAG0752381.1 hypothetical protein G6F24_013612 [Rhizopus arrhizus]KAG0782044.1 hypothetical protein G6F22_009289 [Rhizopus arrhizus]KAG0782318.1 hypothetical protein G6F21_011180 [Rhizopus arrhizus]KAG0804078.1 hypothetical protein G6F20_012986 [Rhizopus arrhizus]
MHSQLQYNNFDINVLSKPCTPRTSLSSASSSSTFSDQVSIGDISKEGGKKINKKQYECEHCCKVFARPSALKTHKYTHTGEKPFGCSSPGCNSRFSVVSNLRRHLRIHQKPAKRIYFPSEERVRGVKMLMEMCQTNTPQTFNPPFSEGYLLPQLPKSLPSVNPSLTTEQSYHIIDLPLPRSSYPTPAEYSPYVQRNQFCAVNSHGLMGCDPVLKEQQNASDWLTINPVMENSFHYHSGY